MREGDNSSWAGAGRIKQGPGTGPGLWKVPRELMFRKVAFWQEDWEDLGV